MTETTADQLGQLTSAPNSDDACTKLPNSPGGIPSGQTWSEWREQCLHGLR